MSWSVASLNSKKTRGRAWSGCTPADPCSASYLLPFKEFLLSDLTLFLELVQPSDLLSKVRLVPFPHSTGQIPAETEQGGQVAGGVVRDAQEHSRACGQLRVGCRLLPGQLCAVAFSVPA